MPSFGIIGQGAAEQRNQFGMLAEDGMVESAFQGFFRTFDERDPSFSFFLRQTRKWQFLGQRQVEGDSY